MTEPKTPHILPNFKKAFESNAFRNDAHRLLTVGDTEFSAILTRLATATDSLGTSRLRAEIAGAGIANDEQQQLLMRLIPIFARWGRTAVQGKVDSFVATLNAVFHDDFNESELTTLSSRIVALLEGEFPGLALADKCEAVARATGRALRTAQLITDIRPVFDENRERVLAVVPMTTLRLTTESLEDGVPASTLDVQLSELDLLELGRKVAEAQQKLTVMKQLLRDKELELADCGMVLQDGDDQ